MTISEEKNKFLSTHSMKGIKLGTVPYKTIKLSKKFSISLSEVYVENEYNLVVMPCYHFIRIHLSYNSMITFCGILSDYPYCYKCKMYYTHVRIKSDTKRIKNDYVKKKVKLKNVR